MKIYLIRHGESEYNRMGKVQGQCDPPLSAQGETQAELLAEKLKDEFAESGEKISKIYASPLSRTMKTAEPISRKLNLEPEPVPELKEYKLGEWEGKSISELSRNPVFLEWREDPSHATVPGGETMEEFSSRVISSFDSITKKHGARDNIIIVSHGGPIGVILSSIAGQNINGAIKIKQDNTALNLIEVQGDTKRIIFQNDTSHLRTNP